MMLPRRRFAAAVTSLAAITATAILITSGPATGSRVSFVQAATSKPRPARVLLIGDSILDQEGSSAAFLLRQAGVDARAIGIWGSGLLGVTQYDYGRTLPTGGWLHKASGLIGSFDPDVVGVYMNHSYFPPYPHDAGGQEITDLWSASGQRMIGQQARALVNILRARSAKVFFITPAPDSSSADPNVWNPIWHGYRPVLHAMHVAIVDASHPLEAANGRRAETKAACDGSQQRVRPADDVHLTRFGAGRAGTVLAYYVAPLAHAQLLDNAAPGENVAALVPTPSGHGYWLVACDGSVYHFGDAKHLASARAAVAGHSGVSAAVATPSGAGLWLVTADGKIARIGDATAITFRSAPHLPIVDAAGVPGAKGFWATTPGGRMSAAGVAMQHGGLVGVHLNAPITAIAATRTGHGYWLVGADGGVFSFGDAGFHGSAGALRLNGPIAGMAATPSGHGYWLVGTDGGVFTYGDAQFYGTGAWQPPPNAGSVATPGPTIGIASPRLTKQGYWIFGTTGRVSPRGNVGHYGGDNNLAVLTQ
jgi:hypothetical protein